MSNESDKRLGLSDHTIDTPGGIVAGFVLKANGATVGYLWCEGSCWKWRAADGSAFGDRQTKKAAIETLHDVRAAATGQARANRPALPPLITRARPTASFAQQNAAPLKSTPEPFSQAPAAKARQVVWGDNDADGANLTAALGAALNKHKESK